MSLASKIPNWLKTPEPAAAGDHLSETRAALEKTEKALAELTEQRPTILLSGDDIAAASHNDKIAIARREVERLTLAIGRFEQLEAEHEAAEERAAAEETYAEGEKALERGKAIYGEYRQQAENIIALIDELSECHKTIHRANSAARKAGLYAGLRLPHEALSPAGSTLGSPIQMAPNLTETKELQLHANPKRTAPRRAGAGRPRAEHPRSGHQRRQPDPRVGAGENHCQR